MSKEKIMEIQKEIALERERLSCEQNIQEEEKKKIEQDLNNKEAELNNALYVFNMFIKNIQYNVH